MTIDLSAIFKPIIHIICTGLFTAALVLGIAYEFKDSVHDMVLHEIANHEREELKRDLQAMEDMKIYIRKEVHEEVLSHEIRYHDKYGK